MEVPNAQGASWFFRYRFFGYLLSKSCIVSSSKGVRRKLCSRNIMYKRVTCHVLFAGIPLKCFAFASFEAICYIALP